jgi:hypothetical protein
MRAFRVPAPIYTVTGHIDASDHRHPVGWATVDVLEERYDPRAHGLPGRALPGLAAVRMIITEARADQLHLGPRRHSRTSSLSGG